MTESFQREITCPDCPDRVTDDMDRTAFLRARLDEREAEAIQLAKDLDRWHRESVASGACGCQGCILVASALAVEDGHPVPPLHPDRMLADVAAKRQLLDYLTDMMVHIERGTWQWPPFQIDGQQILEFIAMAYADHPDFDPAWCPT